jgi:hypothetical protein
MRPTFSIAPHTLSHVLVICSHSRRVTVRLADRAKAGYEDESHLVQPLLQKSARFLEQRRLAFDQ